MWLTDAEIEQTPWTEAQREAYKIARRPLCVGCGHSRYYHGVRAGLQAAYCSQCDCSHDYATAFHGDR